ncbi:hypothetical protein [Pseudomonas solani]
MSRIAEMDNGKWAHVHADAQIGEAVEIWCVRTGRRYQAVIVGFPCD